MTAICETLNVIEIGSGSAAAAMAGVVLADAGARVVKVEPPEGDALRRTSPSGFLVWNRGKESVVADLRTDEGRDEFRRLVAAADVVIEGFAPGTTAGWGIGADDLRALNPALVHCSITGFGSTGDYSRLKGYDSLVAAKVGLWARGSWGHRHGPIMFPVAWGSFGAAMQSVAGIVGALLVRERTGRGQALEATLVNGLDPIEYFVGTIVQLMEKQGQAPTSDSRAATAASRFAVVAVTSDGRMIQTSTVLPHQGRALCEVAGVKSLLEEPRFARLPMFDSPEDAQAWEDIVLEAFRERDLDYWLPRLLANPDIAFEVAVTSEQGMDHPQIRHNGDVVTVADPVVGAVEQVGPVGHFAATPCVIEKSAPALGQHAGPFVPTPPPAGGGDAPAHPLAGVTIVEFGCFYAMPYALTMAAALGARVIKIEDPSGDPYRASFGPEVGSTKTTAGKESVSLDLRSAEGRAIAQRIVAEADVFVTGYRSGVADKFGLGYDELRAKHPCLLYVHAAGYGTDGPYAERALYAQSASTVGGSYGRQVSYWSQPERNLGMSVLELQAVVLPRLNQIIDGDSNAALVTLAAIALGIYHQHRTGEGQFLRTSMIAGNAWAYSDDFCKYEGKPPAPQCDDEYWGVDALHRLYPAADGTWVCLEVPSQREWQALAHTIGLPELTDDERFRTPASRSENDDALRKELQACFGARPAAKWEAQLSAANVGCVAVNMEGQPVVTVHDPVLRASGLTVTFEHPRFGEMVRASAPVSFSATPARIAPPCARGEHNRTVLAELGYSTAEIDELEASGAVAPPDPA
jgi:crotonobetainyl-CoA:carnitine CoA-transferase CaiB-like acyl-CoA transferase